MPAFCLFDLLDLIIKSRIQTLVDSAYEMQRKKN